MNLVRLDETRPLGKGARLHTFKSSLPAARWVLKWVAERASDVWDKQMVPLMKAEMAAKGQPVDFPKSNDPRIPGTALYRPRKWYDPKTGEIKFWVIYL